MKKIASISGGRTSSYLAANYDWDDYVFALVRTEDKACTYKDVMLRAYVESKIETDFVGTLEDDAIVATMYELEQYIGKSIQWVTGITYDEIVRSKGGWLPNKLHRYCTTYLKIEPIVQWWKEKYDEPIEMGIGFRANEGRRVQKMLEKLNDNGLLEHKTSFSQHEDGRNKWETVQWQKPVFPLYNDRVYADDIANYWQGKPVTFAKYNNCIHCFHRNAMRLRLMAELHPEKMQWAANQEGGKKGYWKSGVSYQKIIDMPLQMGLFENQSGCEDGFCEIE